MNAFNRLSRLAGTVGFAAIAGTMLLAVARPAMAQYSNPNADGASALDETRSSDPFSQDAGFNSLFDLMHRVQTGSGTTYSDFQRQQREGINTEAELFRRRQLEALQQRQQTQSPMGEPQAAPTEPAPNN
ncbi:hypothetical protein ACQ4M4_20805 [Leptolyngbya sp. AN02str]|uniref:hypothetical protein n=1 Tax=Leptolyngbya sp. AN02str TaxID=3423363 RepID=UPI003D3197B7